MKEYEVEYRAVNSYVVYVSADNKKEALKRAKKITEKVKGKFEKISMNLADVTELE